MYAVIRTGGKQYKVAEGERLDVERLSPDGDDRDVSFIPVLLVDGERVVAAPADLSSAQVTARVVGEAKGPKIRGLTYKNKTNSRKRWGHRQKYTTIEITAIAFGHAAGIASGHAAGVASGAALGTESGPAAEMREGES
jgi:large subunit ribosomal protein L21